MNPEAEDLEMHVHAFMIGHPLPEESIDDSVRSTDGCMSLVLAESGLWTLECDGRWLMARCWKSARLQCSGGPVRLERTPWPTR